MTSNGFLLVTEYTAVSRQSKAVKGIDRCTPLSQMDIGLFLSLHMIKDIDFL